MLKLTANYRKGWTPEELQELQTLALANVPVEVISLRLARTLAAVRAKAREEHIELPSLKMKNRK